LVKILDKLIEHLSSDCVIGPLAISERASSFWDPSPMEAIALVKPRTTQDISLTLKLCHESGQGVIIHGGLSGCCQGAKTSANKVVISLERMDKIETIDHIGMTATIEAGATLENVQNEINENGFYFPLDLGARGSCMIGGNVATNAGGINVIRYGMMRNQVLGLEAVLADGTILSSMNQMLKNNAGYDLKQLFIGTEGTLGIVTRVVVKLEMGHTSQNTGLVALNSFNNVKAFLAHMKGKMGGILSAYEVMWGDYYRAVTSEGWHTSPMGRDHNYYVIVECDGTHKEQDETNFLNALEGALETGFIEDAVLPKSESERRAIWNIRENFEALYQNKPIFLYDVSLPIKNMEYYINEVQARLKQRWGNVFCSILGHIGDGNLHLFVCPGEGGEELHIKSDEDVYTPLVKYGGSVSAEHGIGTEKKAWLHLSRSPVEIKLMKHLKKSLDPKGILNPGVIFD